MNRAEQPNFKKLRIIQISAVADAILVLIIALYLMGQFSKPELAPVVMSIAFAAFTFGAVFYFGCLLLEPSLVKFIKEDRTVIKSDTVEMVTDTYSSGDAEIDEWVNRFVFARNLFGMSIVPLLILGGLWLFS